MIFTSNRYKNINLSLIAAVFISLTGLFGLQACSSSSSTPVVNEDASGLFKGIGTVNTNTALADVRGFVHGTRFMFFDEDTSVLYDGQITGIVASDITGTTDVYKDGVKVSTSTVTGTVTSQSTLSLTLTGSGYGAGSLSLTFDLLYNRSATVAKLATISPARWVGDPHTTAGGSVVRIKSVDIDDTIEGDTGAPYACLYTGTKSIPDATANIYQLTLVVEEPGTTCDHEGTGYTGFFAVVDGSAAEDTLLFAATNGTNANFSIMTVQ